MEPDLDRLREQLREEDIDWRIQSVGKNNKGKWWAKIVPYADARMLMDRLDEAVGPGNWQDHFRPAPTKDGGVLCAIGIKIDGEWVWKEDGAPNTEIEKVKGGFTTSFRRTAVKWDIMGIRALYDVDGELWAKVTPNGRCIARLGKKHDYAEFNYNPPNILKDPNDRGTPPKPEREEEEERTSAPATNKQKKLIVKLLRSSKITPSENDGIHKKMKEDGTKDRATRIIEWLKETIDEREKVLEMDPDQLDLVKIEVNGIDFSGTEFVEWYREIQAASEEAA